MSRRSLKHWLVAANGWQRIWFAGTVVCLIYFVVIFPITETNKSSLYGYERLWAAEREMKNPACLTYMSGEFSTLAEPAYSKDGSTCYNIYSHRKYSEDQKPITKEMYIEDFNSKEQQAWLAYIGMGAFIAVLLSVLVYAVGAVASWIVRGFKKSEKQ